MAGWDLIVLGSWQKVQQQISAQLPGVEWLAASCGYYVGEGFSLKIDLGFEEPVICFAAEVHGRGAALAGLLQFTVPNRWHLLDGWTGEVLNPDSLSEAGLVACQQYWNEVRRFFDTVVPLPGKGRLF